MAIGSLDKVGRLAQLRDYARCEVWSGYTPPEQVRADVVEAVRAEVRDADRAARLADEMIGAARRELDSAAADWPDPTDFERLQQVLALLRDRGLVVMEAINDHWDAHDELERLGTFGERPRGIAYFTLGDVWHAVQHGMLELNVWHGDTANTAPGDPLLDEVLAVLDQVGLPGSFDEGRIELTLQWQRRPTVGE